MENDRNPKIGVAIILLMGDEVLLGKRKNSHGAGTWSFPGGKLENYETFMDCSLRELKEETGLFGFQIDLIDKIPCALTEDFFPESLHYVTHYLRAKHNSGIPLVKEKDKCERWEWFSWGNFPNPLFLPVENLIKQKYNPFL
ncbi:MAG: NUDIX domain-containing protein [Nanoarchaeota archaeon]|nr:NUDIX domain-containing protein [Nanoarchaeota archaeon]